MCFPRLSSALLISFLFIATISCNKDDEDGIADESFFTFKVPSDYEEDGSVREYWIFLSNEMGEPLGAKKFVKGDVLQFSKPIDHSSGKLYSFSIVKLYIGSSFEPGISRTYYNFIATYSEVKAGEYTLRKENRDKQPQSIGTCSITINNLPAITPFLVSTGGKGTLYASNDGLVAAPIPYPVSLSQNSADIFHFTLDVKKNIPKYFFIQNVQSGQKETLNYTDMKTPTQISFPLLKDSYVGAKLEAISQIGDYENSFYIYRDSPLTNLFQNSSKLYFPPEINYPEYITSINRSGSDYARSYRLIASKPSSVEKNLEADITSLSNTGESINLKTTGEYDASVTLSGEIINISPSENAAFTWLVYMGPSNDKSAILPKIPEDIINSPLLSQLKNYQFKFTSTDLIEYPDMSGYEDFIEATFRYPGHLDSKFKEMMIKTRFF